MLVCTVHGVMLSETHGANSAGNVRVSDSSVIMCVPAVIVPPNLGWLHIAAIVTNVTNDGSRSDRRNGGINTGDGTARVGDAKIGRPENLDMSQCIEESRHCS